MSRLLFWVLPIFLFACQQSSSSDTQNNTARYSKLRGITMGVVPYQITFKNDEKRDLHPEIKMLLEELNMGSSTYEPQSIISRFNQSDSGITVADQVPASHFIQNVLMAKEVVADTDGYFDPTVAPLVNWYGFGNEGKEGVERIDTPAIKQLLKIVGFDKISIDFLEEDNKYRIQKEHPDVQLDFSAIAKGYAVDETGRFLESKGINDYLVEIGGEVRARGKNSRDTWWKIAIKKPAPEASEGYFMTAPLLENLSMATSGNYENYRIVAGKKIGHTMNPKTGFPELNPLLSASVFSKNCMLADSYATAFMAMGLEKAWALAQNNAEIEAYFVYLNEEGNYQTRFTDGLKGVINEEKE